MYINSVPEFEKRFILNVDIHFRKEKKKILAKYFFSENSYVLEIIVRGKNCSILLNFYEINSCICMCLLSACKLFRFDVSEVCSALSCFGA